MTYLLNAKLKDGGLYTLQIENSKWKSIQRQTQIIVKKSEAVSLEDACSKVRNFNESVVIDCKGSLVLPALADVHIHSRDPGLTYKEDWTSVERCAAKGGVAAVVDMPNTKPPMMDESSVREKVELASRSGILFRLLLGVGEKNISNLANLLKNKELPLCGAKIFYGQSTGNLMYSDLDRLARELKGCEDKILVFHSEDQCGVDRNLSSLKIDDFGLGNLQFRYHTAVRNSQTAYTSTQKILDWAVKFPFKVHIAHVSTPKEVDMILEAKAKGAIVSGEVAPHHLFLNEDDYERLGPFLKMNPPVRSRKEQQDLLEHFGKNHIEIFSTDHAPHTFEEKLLPYDQCPSGVPALDFFTPLLLRASKLSGLSLSKAIDTACKNASQLFGISEIGDIEEGNYAHFQIIDESRVWTADEADVVSKCGWTPYIGFKFDHQVLLSTRFGQTVYCKSRAKN